MSPLPDINVTYATVSPSRPGLVANKNKKKTMFFLPTARHGKKDGGGGSREGGGNRNDALGPRVQELFEFSLYLMKWPGKTNLKLSVTPPPTRKFST